MNDVNINENKLNVPSWTFLKSTLIKNRRKKPRKASSSIIGIKKQDPIILKITQIIVKVKLVDLRSLLSLGRGIKNQIRAIKIPRRRGTILKFIVISFL